MVAGAFPIIKLGYLAVKQLSRPIANQIKRNAKSSPFFGKYVCMPPAQIYHWLEVNFRLSIMGLGKAKRVHKLTDEMAIELGAEMLGEFIVFVVAAGTICMEYLRSKTKDALKEENGRHEVLMMKQRLEDLDLMTRVHDAKIRELQRTVDALDTENQSLFKSLFGDKEKEPEEKEPEEPEE
ncbi:hypothetical protein ACOMHN_006473 [Nucella lapillus]